MRHGIDVIVIETTEQAEEVIAALDAMHEKAVANDYAAERAKPIKWMQCGCCGSSYQGRQWFNQEPGYGLGDCCVRLHGIDGSGGESGSFGAPGIHFLIPQEEKDSPAIIPMRGQPLYGMDERLRIEYDGYVFWKGREIDHYSGSLLEDSEQSRASAVELIRRCELLESRGVEVNTNSVVWKWSD